MQMLVAKLICRLFAVGLVALAASIALGFTGTAAAAGLIILAVGLASLQQWAILPAYAIPLFYAVESVADAIHVRWLRPSGAMPGLLGNRFRSNLTVHYLLERPANFFEWYGIPEQIAQILLCLMAIVALAYAHQALQKSGLLRRWTERDKLRFASIIGVVSKVVVIVAILTVAMAVWKDPPRGGSNPGGPSPGAYVVFAVLFAGPWLIAGGIGWALSAWWLRTKGEKVSTPFSSSD
jgi:hypothetical protein